ncbi:hypothetical protein AU387_04865 [Bacillus halotolerans]|nr:hypothetical protein AU387_04865 [Bacillus halotolerans]
MTRIPFTKKYSLFFYTLFVRSFVYRNKNSELICRGVNGVWPDDPEVQAAVIIFVIFYYGCTLYEKGHARFYGVRDDRL